MLDTRTTTATKTGQTYDNQPSIIHHPRCLEHRLLGKWMGGKQKEEKTMNSWGKTLEAMVSIAILGLCSWLFKVDFQLLLLLSIAYDLTYIRIEKEEEKK